MDLKMDKVAFRSLQEIHKLGIPMLHPSNHHPCIPSCPSDCSQARRAPLIQSASCLMPHISTLTNPSIDQCPHSFLLHSNHPNQWLVGCLAHSTLLPNNCPHLCPDVTYQQLSLTHALSLHSRWPIDSPIHSTLHPQISSPLRSEKLSCHTCPATSQQTPATNE